MRAEKVLTPASRYSLFKILNDLKSEMPSSEMWADFYQIKRRYNPEGHNLDSNA